MVAVLIVRWYAPGTFDSASIADSFQAKRWPERFAAAADRSVEVSSVPRRDLAAPAFEKTAGEHHWQIRRYEPFWELCSGNDEGKALRYLMRLYREALRSRVRSVAIGKSAEDLSLLAASDQAFILPLSSGRFDENLTSKVPNAARIDVPGTSGWNQTVLSVLSRE